MRRPTFVVLTAAIAVLAGAVPSQAVVVPGLTQYDATLDVAGRFVVTVHDDSTATCAPGQDITRTIEVNMEMGRPRDVVVSITKNSAATTPARSSGAGEVKVTTELVKYAETNYCDGQPPAELVKPDCGEASGDISAALQGAAEKGSFPISLSASRLNGGHLKFSPECELPSLEVDQDDYHLSLFPSKGTGMLVPLGITAKSLKSLRRGKALARRVSLSGPCKNIDAASEKARIILPARHTCKIAGSVWTRLKRAR